jgi:hypothetical protein
LAAPEGSFIRRFLSFEEISNTFDPPAKKKRAAKEVSDWKASTWYTDYVLRKPTTKKAIKKFRRRFRLPHRKFLELVRLAFELDWFPTFGKPDAVGVYGAPIEILILGALRYLGRGWTFDDIEEQTNVSEETHRRFFHEFVEVGSTAMYAMWVKTPATADDLASSRREYSMAGQEGCFGSGDGTHVTWEKCYARMKHQHTGFKSSLTTRAYNLVCNHRRRILSTSRGAPGSWCDKTLIRFDTFLVDLHQGRILQVSFVNCCCMVTLLRHKIYPI